MSLIKGLLGVELPALLAKCLEVLSGLPQLFCLGPWRWCANLRMLAMESPALTSKTPQREDQLCAWTGSHRDRIIGLGTRASRLKQNVGDSVRSGFSKRKTS